MQWLSGQVHFSKYQTILINNKILNHQTANYTQLYHQQLFLHWTGFPAHDWSVTHIQNTDKNKIN